MSILIRYKFRLISAAALEVGEGHGIAGAEDGDEQAGGEVVLLFEVVGVGLDVLGGAVVVVKDDAFDGGSGADAMLCEG